MIVSVILLLYTEALHLKPTSELLKSRPLTNDGTEIDI